MLDKATDEAGNLDPGTSINAGNSPFVVRKEGTLYTHGRSDRYPPKPIPLLIYDPLRKQHVKP